MKKYIVTSVSIAVVITFISAFFNIINKERNKKLITTQPWVITSLRESIEIKGIKLEDACANSSSLSKDTINLEDSDIKQRFTYLCEDIEKARILEENFSNNLEYNYFLNCAKIHAANMQQITDDLKAHYPEDYKELNFNKEKQENILVKYLKHPKSAFLMAQCESKTEALYWRSIINSSKVEDLKFCQKITEECINGVIEASECPTNFKNYHDECTKKLNKMKH